MLWVALHFPLLSLESFAATLPPADTSAARGEQAVALVDEHRISAANAAAQAQGVKPGLKRATALALAPRLILGQADPYAKVGGERELSLREAVTRASAHVDARLRDDPAAAAAVHAMVGAVFFAQDRHDEAIAAYQRARDLYRSAGAGHDAARVRVDTGLCDVQRIAGRLRRAEEACQSALQLARESGEQLDFATLKLGQLRAERLSATIKVHYSSTLATNDASLQVTQAVRCSARNPTSAAARRSAFGVSPSYM